MRKPLLFCFNSPRDNLLMYFRKERSEYDDGKFRTKDVFLSKEGRRWLYRGYFKYPVDTKCSFGSGKNPGKTGEYRREYRQRKCIRLDTRCKHFVL